MVVNRTPSSSWANGYTLLLACLAVYLPLFWQIPLIRAEAMYALIPKEMLASGTWLTPTLNGVPYIDKPQLFYWLNLLAYKLFGVSDRVARLPLLGVTLGEVWFTYLIGRRLLGQTAAWLGSFALFTSIGFFVLHQQLLMDHLVTLGLVASLYFFLRWQEEPSFKWAGPFFLSLVVGFLGKGFIGLVFPLLIGSLYAWQQHRLRTISLFWSPAGLALLGALLIPWLVSSELANPGFFRFQVVNEQILRFLGQRQPPDINSFPIVGYWLFLGIWLMPYTPLLPEALWRFWGETAAGGQRQGRLLIIWPAVILIFFTLSASRIEYYSLPALPPLALIAGWRLERYLETPADRALAWSLAVIALLGLALLFLLPHLEHICAGNRREFVGMFRLISPIARPVSFLVPSLALAGLGAALIRRRRLALACYGVLAVALVFFTFRTYLTISPLLSDQIPGEFIRQHAAPQDLVVMEKIEEFEYGASLEFYSGHHILMVRRNGMPQFPYQVPAGKNYLISPEQLGKLWRGPRRVFLLVDNVTPLEPFLKDAPVLLSMPSKRLLSNRP